MLLLHHHRPGLRLVCVSSLPFACCCSSCCCWSLPRPAFRSTDALRADLGPNQAYDDFAGHDPPHTSRRNLISDIADALKPKNIRLGVYLPYEAPMEDHNVSEKLEFRYLPHVSQDLLGGRFPLGRTIANGSRAPWEPERYGLDDTEGAIFGHGQPYGFGTDRLVKFQTEWNKIIAGWSRLYGDKVSAWWFDVRALPPQHCAAFAPSVSPTLGSFATLPCTLWRQFRQVIIYMHCHPACSSFHGHLSLTVATIERI